MIDYPDLEIRLQPRAGARFELEMTFRRPDSSARVALLPPGHLLGQFDPAEAGRLLLQPDEYGHWLGKLLCQDPAIEIALAQALSSSQLLGAPLRVRLLLPEALQPLRWETLRLPTTGARLTTSENSPFSRFLQSSDLRPVNLRSQAEMKALVVVANPTNLEAYEPGGVQLAPIDVAGELARARMGLGEVAISELAAAGQATLANIREQCRADFDILYLVCHGTFARGETIVWLEDASGAAAPTDGQELVTLLAESRTLPRLVVLASCQSAGDGRDPAAGDSRSLAALGPSLAAAGVPAVVAMQGYISMETVSQFMPVFFHQLGRDGEIDRAMAAARAAVKERPDWWMPVLYMRLENGRLRAQNTTVPDRPAPLARTRPAPQTTTPQVDPALFSQPLSRSQRSALRRQVNSLFDLNELVELCFDLDIDFENMAGATKSAKIISLITFAERHGRMPELLAMLVEARPELSW